MIINSHVEYEYTFLWVKPEDVLYNSKYKSPITLVDEIQSPFYEVIGFDIKSYENYNPRDATVLIKYEDILYYVKASTLMARKKFTGRICCTDENIYYYLYSKRPYETHKLKITSIPKHKGGIKSKERIGIECGICNYMYDISINKFLSGTCCPKCTNQRTETVDDIKNDINENLYRNQFEFISAESPNLGKDSKIFIKCLRCHTETHRAVSSSRNGNIVCRECDQFTNLNFIRKIQEKQPFSKSKMHYYYVSEITNSTSEIGCKCDDCGHQSRCTINDAMLNKLCEYCKGKYTNENVVYRIKTIRNFEEEGIKIVSIPKIKNAFTKIKFECANKHQFTMSISKFVSGQICAKCITLHQSKAVRAISNFLTQKSYVFVMEKIFPDCKNILPLPFDFYIKDLNILIEYDGEQHFKPIDFFGGMEKFEKQKLNDSIKNKYCNDNGIKLIRIRFDENPIDILKKNGL